MTVQDQRPRFFEGQYLGAADLEAAIDYVRLQQARHLLGGHTWGIAAGLQLVERAAAGGGGGVDVLIEPGFAWDGFGRPILLASPQRVPEALFADFRYDAALDADGIADAGRAGHARQLGDRVADLQRFQAVALQSPLGPADRGTNAAFRVGLRRERVPRPEANQSLDGRFHLRGTDRRHNCTELRIG